MRYLLILTFLAGCATTTPPPSPAPPAEEAAPWNASAAVSRTAAPAVLLAQWEQAENRATCAPLTIVDFGPRASHATARRATFSGGWAVAWDAPGLPGRDASGSPCETCGRGVFGIAGTGTAAAGGGAWNPGNELEWAGENRATYGLEGGTGPNWLANVQVDDQRCLYQVWSFLGRDHLEHLIENIRRVDSEF